MRFRHFFLCCGKMAYCQRAFAFSSLSRASTQRLPDGVFSFFQYISSKHINIGVVVERYFLNPIF